MGVSVTGTKLKFDGHEISCLFGDFDIEETRDAKKKKCTIGGGTKTILGDIVMSDITLLIPKGDPANAQAEAAIRAAFLANDVLAFEIEDNDKPEGGTNGSKIGFNCRIVKNVTKYKEDDELEFEFTFSVDGDITRTAAA